MSDFDSNPFADPDLNNPFKVSVVPGLSRRRRRRGGESLFVKTDKFLRAHRARPSLLLSAASTGVGGPFGVRARAPASLVWGLGAWGVGAEPLQLGVRTPFPTSCPPPRERARGRRPSSWQRAGGPGRWSCHLPGKLGGPTRPGRRRRGREGGLPSGGVVMGTRGGGAELCLE